MGLEICFPNTNTCFKRQAHSYSVVTANGINSVINGKKAGFLYASTNAEEMLKESSVNTIVVATQHNTHSKYVIDGLNANKHVWVEKPLAIDKEGYP